ncbi:hypothetical protein HanRHA438_Chr16g0788581 [Helianthus annuus]|nr:hypothetical protein HanLR1_Chr16g0644931 [Helianthus annuus]KAJ0646900.1 hypothetical protein HanOQP8_Chr16g0640261 [Helianthus annuus]KAJ0823668.1 hypothetical protein HanPSC8_Chr16g0746331 [Helianthus annuus]KAJ0838398.1 hypothetical protein HanRHA438_Chr16g0788581 [Helianthus annuus]
MMAKKQKILAEKKRELDEEVAPTLSEKKLKMMGETVAPSESEVDLGVFTRKLCNLLEKIFEASSLPRGMILGCLWLSFWYPPSSFTDNSLFLLLHLTSLPALFLRVLRDQHSAITPPTYPPPVSFDASPPHPDPKGKGKEGTVEGDALKKATTPVALGVVIQEGVHVEGVETDYESSEATPPQGTIYTRRDPSTPRGCGPSGSRQGPESRKVEAGGTWMDHNPSCDDLPHVPHWGLLQGSQMDDLENCHDFIPCLSPVLKGCIKRTTTISTC